MRVLRRKSTHVFILQATMFVVAPLELRAERFQLIDELLSLCHGADLVHRIGEECLHMRENEKRATHLIFAKQYFTNAYAPLEMSNSVWN